LETLPASGRLAYLGRTPALRGKIQELDQPPRITIPDPQLVRPSATTLVPQLARLSATHLDPQPADLPGTQAENRLATPQRILDGNPAAIIDQREADKKTSNMVIIRSKQTTGPNSAVRPRDIQLSLTDENV